MKKRTKLAAAVELGRRGGLKGGPARRERLSAEQRSAIARHAAEVRWANHEARSPQLQAQIDEGFAAYQSGETRPVEEFMAELEGELNEEANQPTSRAWL